MGEGEHVPPIFMKGGIHGNVPQYFRSDAVFVDSSDSNCCLLYFNANIMCSFTKKASASGDFVPKNPPLGPVSYTHLTLPTIYSV